MISVTLNCRLTRDPETKYTPSGTAICSLGLADSNIRKGQNGERIEEPVFIDCEFFGKRAESISQYFFKGSGICITGKLVMDRWQDKNTGENRSKLKIMGNDWSFPVADPKGSENQHSQRQAAPQGQQPNYGGYQQQPQQQPAPAPQQGYAPRQAPPQQGYQQPAPPPRQQRQAPPPAPQQGYAPPPQQGNFQQGGFQNNAAPPATNGYEPEDDIPF
jgi:single-strand DNA-binding protein